MKNKKSLDINIPEFEFYRKWLKLEYRISHIRPIYWLFGFATILVAMFALVPDYMWAYVWAGIKHQRILISMLLFFSLIAMSLVWSKGQQIDASVFAYLNIHGKRAPFFDWIMLCITQVGSGTFAMIIAFILLLRNDILLSYELALGSLTLWMFVELLKIIFHRTRPYLKINYARVVGSIARGSSFPSGHTSQSFFTVTLLARYYHSGIHVLVLLYAVAALVGITRIYVGMHYPRDVMGGAILGTSWALAGVLVYNYI